ncbi:MAG: thiamine phosphate synthase [Leptospiraceae bacterium]|nr:thiamine phosphate synthase [Leptospiraceae bacterium]
MDFCNTQNILLEDLIRLWENFPDCISFFQLRAKSISLSEYKALYNHLRTIFPNSKIIINDFWEFALEINAFGIHIGKEDFASLSTSQKALLKNAKTILKGTSSHSLEDLRNLDQTLWDYSGFGPIFPTNTKKTNTPPLGVRNLELALNQTSIPLVPIGGINSENFFTLGNFFKITPASISMMANEKSLIKIVDFIRKSLHPV